LIISTKNRRDLKQERLYEERKAGYKEFKKPKQSGQAEHKGKTIVISFFTA
jgi:hypothetical protein|tara:strand:+ start:288 stop:440 length:153 start_codon:yes stop_codon:yes gene_type:complete